MFVTSVKAYWEALKYIDEVKEPDLFLYVYGQLNQMALGRSQSNNTIFKTRYQRALNASGGHTSKFLQPNGSVFVFVPGNRIPVMI